jgi:hypothetical protein
MYHEATKNERDESDQRDRKTKQSKDIRDQQIVGPFGPFRLFGPFGVTAAYLTSFAFAPQQANVRQGRFGTQHSERSTG